jgi:DNA polymerase
MELFRIVLREGADLEGFRDAARRLVARQAPPEAVLWGTQAEAFFGADLPEAAPPLALPRPAAALIETVICHRDPARYALLYTLIWRLLHGERHLPEVASDPLMHRLETMRKAVHRDLHKMHAFLRFREVADPDGAERYVAWFEPDHHILEAAAPFFIERFRGLAWSILTPLGALHWNREALSFGPPPRRGCGR